MTTQAMVHEDLHHFIEEHADDYYALRLIFFFARYPSARFSRRAIFGALGLNSNHLGLKQALANLVQKKITDVCDDNPVPVYRLAEDTPIRGRIIEIGKLSFNEKQELLRLARS